LHLLDVPVEVLQIRRWTPITDLQGLC